MPRAKRKKAEPATVETISSPESSTETILPTVEQVQAEFEAEKQGPVDGGAGEPEPTPEAPKRTRKAKLPNVRSEVVGRALAFGFNSVFRRIGWEPLQPDERQELQESVTDVINKHSTFVASWAEEVRAATVVTVIIANRTIIPLVLKEVLERAAQEAVRQATRPQ